MDDYPSVVGILGGVGPVEWPRKNLEMHLHLNSELLRGTGFDTRSGNIISFLLPLFQEGQFSVTGESMCTKYWLTA